MDNPTLRITFGQNDLYTPETTDKRFDTQEELAAFIEGLMLGMQYAGKISQLEVLTTSADTIYPTDIHQESKTNEPDKHC